MADRKQSLLWPVQLTFLLALYLQALPMQSTLLYWRPEWLLLVVIYWTLYLPQRVGIFHALVWGLLLDLIEGTLLGHNAIALMVPAYLCHHFYQRIRMFSVWQQSLFVVVLVIISQLLFQWLQGGLVIPGAALGFLLLPALVSGFLWGWLASLLASIKRRFSLV